MLSSESRRVAGILLVVFPTVLYGGVSLLMFLINRNSVYGKSVAPKSFSRRARACRSVAGAVANRPPLCGRGAIGRRMEAVCAFFDPFRRHFPSGWLFLFCAFAARDRTQWLYLPGICRGCGSRRRLTDFGSWAAEEYQVIPDGGHSRKERYG